MTESVIAPADEEEYHRSKSGFYTACGLDYNPHHAVRLERQKARRLAYAPCSECFPDDPENPGEDY